MIVHKDVETRHALSPLSLLATIVETGHALSENVKTGHALSLPTTNQQTNQILTNLT